jgi:hypothetical protein
MDPQMTDSTTHQRTVTTPQRQRAFKTTTNPHTIAAVREWIRFVPIGTGDDGQLIGLRNTGASSARLGPCNWCGEHCSEVYSLLIGRPTGLFGHHHCLREAGFHPGRFVVNGLVIHIAQLISDNSDDCGVVVSGAAGSALHSGLHAWARSAKVGQIWCGDHFCCERVA